jgi:hypothetical protein
MKIGYSPFRIFSIIVIFGFSAFLVLCHPLALSEFDLGSSSPSYESPDLCCSTNSLESKETVFQLTFFADHSVEADLSYEQLLRSSSRAPSFDQLNPVILRC